MNDRNPVMRPSTFARFLSSLRRVGRAGLAERQLIVRSQGRIAYLRLTRAGQLFLFLVVAGCAGWAGFTTQRYLAFDDIVAGKDAQLARADRAYRSLFHELKETQSRFDTVTRALQANQEHLLGVIERNQALRDSLLTTESQLKTELSETKKQLGDRIRLVSSALKAQLEARERRHREELEFLQKSLASTEEKRRTAVQKGKTYVQEIGELQGRIVALDETTKRLEQSLNVTETALTTTAEKRVEVAADRDRLNRRVMDLEGRLANLKDDQTELLNRIVEATVDDIERTHHIIAATGVEAEDLIPSPNTAQGGPFVPFRKPEPDESFEAVVTALHSQLDHWDQLRGIVRSLPLAAPLDEYYVSSSFGRRRDPINHRWAMHAGLDLGAPMRSPVYSPAPGLVTYAGWKGRFGRMVEIDHGSGIVTRYGHLRKVTVKRGETVGYRQKIGLLGSSGRSTGPHLHYEVEVNGKRIDPARFLQAGKHVFKGIYASN